MRHLRALKNSLSIALAVLLFAMWSPATTLAQNAVVVNGGGEATLSDGGTSYPLQFGISGTLNGDGSAHGHINFVFPPPFSTAWGAVPGVDRIHIGGRVTSHQVLADGSHVLEGTLTERDYINGQGLVFIEGNVPFRIELGGSLAPGNLLLQWCLLPVFPVEVTNGSLVVR